MRYLPALLIGRLVRFAVRLVRPGGGSALPGLIVSKLAPGLVNELLGRFPKGLIVITGTAGKSTTTKMAVAIARAHGMTVFTNPSTANIEQGFFSTIVKSGTLTGKYPADVAILEMDEGHAAALAKEISPTISVILNVFDDQLDRFIEPQLVREKLLVVAKNTTEKVLLNGDDQNCLVIAKEIRTPADFFGISPNLGSFEYSKTYLDPISKPNLRNAVVAQTGREVTLSTSSGLVNVQLPARGLHFALDAVAAWTVAEQLLGAQFNPELAKRTLDELPPVFSRGEIKVINGEEVEFILIQNPISTQLNIDNLETVPEQLMFAIGRDVHDPSWLWTVDYSKLDHVSLVSGFNYADAALVLAYNGIPVERVEADYFKAIDDFLDLPKPEIGRKTVLYSADAMRRLRRYKGFTDPEDVKRV